MTFTGQGDACCSKKRTSPRHLRAACPERSRRDADGFFQDVALHPRPVQFTSQPRDPGCLIRRRGHCRYRRGIAHLQLALPATQHRRHDPQLGCHRAGESRWNSSVNRRFVVLAIIRLLAPQSLSPAPVKPWDQTSSGSIAEQSSAMTRGIAARRSRSGGSGSPRVVQRDRLPSPSEGSRSRRYQNRPRIPTSRVRPGWYSLKVALGNWK